MPAEETPGLVAALRSVELFHGIPEATLQTIAAQLRLSDLAEGEVVLAQESGGGMGRMYIVISGTAVAEVDDRTIAAYGPGDHFGEMSLLDGRPRSATIRATSPLRLAGLASWNLRAIVKEQPSVAMAIIETLAGRLREANRRLAEN